MTRTLYLWTASGIFLHCKIINTSQAWELFSQIGEALSMENHPILENVIFSKIKPTEAKPDLAYVYAIEFDNGFVKIGMSNNVDTRKGSIRRKLKFKDVRTYHTDFIARQKALQIENFCHNFFRDRLAYRREYFRIPFEEACKVINAFVEVVACLPQVSNFERADKLLTIVTMMADDSSERHQVLFSSTKLIAGEKFS